MDYTSGEVERKSSYRWMVVVIGAVLLIGGLIVTYASATSGENDDSPVEQHVYELPWDVQWTEDNHMFYTERCKGLSVLLADGRRSHLVGAPPALLEGPDMFCIGQSGFHGVALDPEFGDESSEFGRDVYLFFASDIDAPRTNRIARITLADNLIDAPVERVDIVTDMSFKDAANDIGGPGAHSGGRIRFGLPGTIYENYLFITLGDNHKGDLPQDLFAPGSKVLAVDRNGDPMPGNVIGSGDGNPDGDPRIFAYGFRNIQGIDFRPGTDQIYIAEHGPQFDDEVTKLVNGGNGGWDPQNRDGLDCPSDYCGYAGDRETMPMTDLVRFPDAIEPTWNNNQLSQGMTPCVFLRGEQWGSYEGWLAVGYLSGQRIVLLKLTEAGDGVTSIREPQGIPVARYRSITNSPISGGVTVSTDAGDIFDIEVDALLNFDVVTNPDEEECIILPPGHPPVSGTTCD